MFTLIIHLATHTVKLYLRFSLLGALDVALFVEILDGIMRTSIETLI